MAAPKRIALYARVSTEDQDFEPQLVRMREWATHGNFEIADEFKETASGRLTRRPEQDRLMALVRGRHVHAVAVAKLDRWGRSIIDLRNTLEVMVDNGVWLYVVDSGVVYEKHTPTGKLMFNQLASFAEFEADLISERTKESLNDRKNRTKPWVSKSGRTVSKLGHEFKTCHDCNGPREDQTRGKRGGKTVMLCRSCKGLPALPKKKEEPEKVVYVETQGDGPEPKAPENSGPSKIV